MQSHTLHEEIASYLAMTVYEITHHVSLVTFHVSLNHAQQGLFALNVIPALNADARYFAIPG